MPIANYTTTVASDRSIAAITKMLVQHGARGVATQYDEKGRAVALSFAMQLDGGQQQYRLPVRIHAVQEALRADRVAQRYQSLEHAERVAWRIIQDWVRNQLALITIRMTKMDEIMLPFMLVGQGETVYERYEIQRQLPGDSRNG